MSWEAETMAGVWQNEAQSQVAKDDLDEQLRRKVLPGSPYCFVYDHSDEHLSMLMQLARRRLENQEERVSESWAPNAPPIQFHSGGSFQGHWDRLRLEQVLENLLSNAMKYSAGNPIAVSTESGEGRVKRWFVIRGSGLRPRT